jgi:hypothetical protein
MDGEKRQDLAPQAREQQVEMKDLDSPAEPTGGKFDFPLAKPNARGLTHDPEFVDWAGR